MSDRLKTVAEWERMGFHVMEHEHSEHKNKWGEYLFRPDQVEEDYIEEFDDTDEAAELNFWLAYDEMD